MENLKKAMIIRNGNIVGAVGDKNFSTAPIGTVLAYAGNEAPRGYLLADGASYPTTEYPDLYAVIGNTYGGDSTNFNVPNLVDKFIQGSTTSGTEKEAGLPNITGQIGNTSESHAIFYAPTTNGAFTVNKNAKLAGGGTVTGDWYANASFDASRSNAIYGNSDTVQPPALTMVYIIKAFHTNEGVDSGVSDDVVEYVEGEIESAIRMSEDIEPTDLVFSGDTAYFDFGAGNNKYEVKNGICYFQVYIRTNAQTTDTMLEIVRGLPKPKFMRNFNVTPYVWADNTYTPLWACIDEDGVLQACKGGIWYSYFINGSYPIA